MKELHEYVKNIKTKIEPSTEYTLRTDFENLLNAQKPRTSINIIQENKKTESQKVRPLEDLTLKLPMKTWN